MLAFVHLLPIALNLVVRDRRDILQDQVMIYVLNEAVLAKLVWFLWLVEYVFHDDLVDLVCLTHSRKSAAFGLFNFRLELLKLDGGRVQGEPHCEREFGVHQEGSLQENAIRVS